jgi:hypothetical protein
MKLRNIGKGSELMRMEFDARGLVEAQPRVIGGDH